MKRIGRISLIWKLILAFVVVALISTTLVVGFIRYTSVDRLNRLIIDQQRNDLKAALAGYYAINNSWAGITENWQEIRSDFVHPIPSTAEGLPFPGQFPGRDRHRLFGLADSQGNVIVPIDPFFPEGEHLTADTLQEGTVIVVNSKAVGTLLVAPLPPNFTSAESAFLQRTNQALLYGTIGALLVALLIGAFLALTLVRPLRALTLAAQNIAKGSLEQQVKVKSGDEIGQLAQAFNRMSQEVARVNQQRRQMTADIAHDLRTPLTVIAGYIESMQDGVLAPTPERLALIYSEIERLQTLVTDLRTLSLADTGELTLQPQLLSPKYFLERAIAPFQHQAEQHLINLRVEARDDLPKVRVDESRMMQVFSNLLSNSFRYTPEGGTILLSAARNEKGIEITVEDNGTGIDAENLPHIFERFYRADKSRFTEGGESDETGLGLAIVKALIEAQGGTIFAESIPGQGTIIRIDFPAGTARISKN